MPAASAMGLGGVLRMVPERGACGIMSVNFGFDPGYAAIANVDWRWKPALLHHAFSVSAGVGMAFLFEGIPRKKLHNVASLQLLARHN
jgi:hypothetical protein